MSDDKANKNKTVPLGDLIAVKEKLKKAEEARAALQSKMAALEAEKRLIDEELSDIPDDDDQAKIKAVKKQLLSRSRELDRRAEELTEKESTLTSKERTLRARELASQYSLDADDLLSSEEDIEIVALRKANEQLSQQKPEVNQEAERIYEDGAPQTSKKSPLDMSAEEFAEHEKKLKAEYQRTHT